MGNVLAASAPPSPPLDSVKIAMPDPAKSSSLEPLESKSDKNVLENPGSVEELHKKCKDIQATTFDGAKVVLNKALSNHFQVSHSLNLGSSQPGCYRFGATYVGLNQISPTEVYPVLLGDIDPSGNLNANVIQLLSPRVRGKFAAQIQDSQVTGSQMSLEYRGDDFTAALTVGNPNIFNNSGVAVAHYLQSVTQNLALGTELICQLGPSVPGGKIAVVSGVARYTSGDSTWSTTLGPGGLHLCYYQKASEQLQIGVELDTSLRVQESTATIGYQIDLPKADLVFRGSVDSNWTVCGLLEKRLQPLPFSFLLSGRLNHNKNQFRVGCGLTIG